MSSSSSCYKSENGSDIDDSHENKRQRLHSDLKAFEIALKLIKNGDSDKLKQMLVKKEMDDVDMKCICGYVDQPYTLRRRASKLGQIECVKILLEHGATVDLLCGKGYGSDLINNSAIFSACSKGHLPIVKVLIEHGADVNNPACPPLCAACSAGDIATVKFLIDQGAEVKAFTSYNVKLIRNPLTAAAHSGNAELVEYLIEKGADIHCEKQKQSPLEKACTCSHYNVLKVLFKHGAKIQNFELHSACKKADLEMVKFLLDRGADIHACNAVGLTPFAVAYSTGNVALVTFLLERGARPNVSIWDSSWAVLRSDTPSATWNPLMYAAEANDIGMMKLLLQHGADSNCAWIYDGERRIKVSSPLITVCRRGHVKALRLLLENGADANRLLKADSGLYETPLMYLFLTNWQVVVQRENPSQAEEDRYENDKLGCLKLLLEYGADLTLANEKGATVFDYVKNRPGILEILNQYTDVKPVLK